VQTDRRGLPVTTGSGEAVACFDETIEHFLSHCRLTPDALNRTLAADPGLVMGHVARGFFAGLLAQRRFRPMMEEALTAADGALEDRGGNARERGYVAALEAFCYGDWWDAAARLADLTRQHPLDALGIKLTHGLYFMLGASAEMRTATEAVLPAWSEAVTGYGYVLGCHAFGLEETGDYDAAERIGRQAVELAPADAWGLHAVAHVQEMTGRPREGIAWLASREPSWGHCNNFGYHVYWHWALFHLELGEADEALALYDRCVRHDRTDDFRDISNGASMLWRLEQEGVAVCDRWGELADLAANHFDDFTLVFADAHYAMALGGAGRVAEAQRFAEAFRAAAAVSPDSTQRRLAQEVGLRLIDAAVAAAAGEPDRVVGLLMPVRAQLQTIGGSHAQRDVFVRLLVDSALAAGRIAEARTVLAERDAARTASLWGQSRWVRTENIAAA